MLFESGSVRSRKPRRRGTCGSPSRRAVCGWEKDRSSDPALVKELHRKTIGKGGFMVFYGVFFLILSISMAILYSCVKVLKHIACITSLQLV